MPAFIHALYISTTLALLASSAVASDFKSSGYADTRFVANKADYKAQFATDKRFINAWGIAIRPAGAGGHFWVTAKDISYEYVGDVRASADQALQRLHQDELKEVKLPVGGDSNVATGTVFSGSADQFEITQQVENALPITAPAKFLFASDGGIISAWTERKNADGTKDFPSEAIPVIDESKSGAQFFGLAMSADFDTLYVADFGKRPAINSYNGKFQPEPILFDSPFDDNKNGRVDAGEYAPFNIQNLKTPEGKNHLFVAYAKTQGCPADAIKDKQCAEGELFAGEEDTSKAGYGRLAEFTEDGRLVRVWNDGGHLSAPWGMAFAPKDFGALSGALLVSNFGDGTIAAFDAKTTDFKDVVRNDAGKPMIIDKIWGILFGNGESLGDSNALYYAAGPKDETDGVFGVLRPEK